MAKFKTSTLVVCGFLVGAHPGHLHHEEAEAELKVRLGLPQEFPFQLNSRTISVPMTAAKNSKRYLFPAVVIETSTKQAKLLREAFFSLPKPVVAVASYP